MHDIKRKLRSALERNDHKSVLVHAREGKQVLTQLVRLAYDKESLVGRRAIEAIGMIARDRVKNEYPVLRELVRKQLWSLSDESGGIGWSAPEIIGEIVSADTVRFRDVIPLIAEVYTVEEKVFRPGVLYALYRIGQADPAVVRPYMGLALQALADQEPYVRIYALMLLDSLKPVLSAKDKEDIRIQKGRLGSDPAEVWLYRDGFFHNETIGDYIRRQAEL